MQNPMDQGKPCVLLEPGLVLLVLLFASHAELHVPVAWQAPPAHDARDQVTGNTPTLRAQQAEHDQR